MLGFLFTYVIPRFAQLYADLHAQLPPITVFMLNIGLAVQRWGLFAAPVIVVGIFLLWRWTRTETGAEWMDRLRLRLPLAGDIWLKYQVAMFARMMSTLLAGGLPL